MPEFENVVIGAGAADDETTLRRAVIIGYNALSNTSVQNNGDNVLITIFDFNIFRA